MGLPTSRTQSLVSQALGVKSFRQTTMNWLSRLQFQRDIQWAEFLNAAQACESSEYSSLYLPQLGVLVMRVLWNQTTGTM